MDCDKVVPEHTLMASICTPTTEGAVFLIRLSSIAVM